MLNTIVGGHSVGGAKPKQAPPPMPPPPQTTTAAPGWQSPGIMTNMPLFQQQPQQPQQYAQYAQYPQYQQQPQVQQQQQPSEQPRGPTGRRIMKGPPIPQGSSVGMDVMNMMNTQDPMENDDVPIGADFSVPISVGGHRTAPSSSQNVQYPPTPSAPAVSSSSSARSPTISRSAPPPTPSGPSSSSRSKATSKTATKAKSRASAPVAPERKVRTLEL